MTRDVRPTVDLEAENVMRPSIQSNFSAEDRKRRASRAYSGLTWALLRAALCLLRGGEVGQRIVGLFAVDSEDDDLGCAAVVELDAIFAIQLEEFELLGGQVQMSREGPFLGTAFVLFLFQLAVKMLEPHSADQQVSLEFVHGRHSRMKSLSLNNSARSFIFSFPESFDSEW